jgi:hypothetical protein
MKTIIYLHYFFPCSCNIDNNRSQYEEYDLDERDFQWLIGYNQFRIEKRKKLGMNILFF